MPNMLNPLLFCDFKANTNPTIIRMIFLPALLNRNLAEPDVHIPLITDLKRGFPPFLNDPPAQLLSIRQRVVRPFVEGGDPLPINK